MNTNTKAFLTHLAKAGDKIADALVHGTSDLTVTAGAEAGNAIPVTIKVSDGAQIVVVEAIGGATLTDGGAGVVVAGSGAAKASFTPDATGALVVAVGQAGAGANTVVVTTSTGDVSVLTVTFA